MAYKMAGSGCTRSLEEVCEFLQKRNVELHVISNFEREKFDGEAVRNSNDASLEELGLGAKGDRMALKAFCNQRQDDRKQVLLQQLRQKWSRGKDEAKPVKQSRKNEKTRRVFLGWMRYDRKAGKYVRVSLSKGGGTRKVDLAINYTRNDVIEYAKKLFFPAEELKDNFVFDLANFKQIRIDTLTDTNGEAHEFSIGKYFEVSKTHQLNLYLMTKEQCDTDVNVNSRTQNTLPRSTSSCTTVTLNDLPSGSCHQQLPKEECNSDDDLMSSVFDAKPPNETTPVNATGVNSNCATVTGMKSVQDTECQADEDQEKEQNKNKSKVKPDKLKALQAARLQRVPPEPALDVVQHKIYIRHPSRGLVSRAFCVDEKMMAVYDWCGSLDSVPEHFSLCTSQKEIILPHECVSSAKGLMLYVRNEKNPVHLIPQDKEVTFKGFGWPACKHGEEDDTLRIADEEMDHAAADFSNYSVEDVKETLPKNIMEGDHKSDTDNLGCERITKSYQNFVQRMGSRASETPGRCFRQWVREVFEGRDENDNEETMDDVQNSFGTTEVKQVTVNRSTVLLDVIELYQDPHIVECKLNVTFRGERGIDFGGVTEDLFCSFWEAAFEEYFDGDVVKIPLASPMKMSAMSNSILPALGRILEHGWRLTKKIPVRFCEASFIAMVHGEEAVSDEVLKRSFLWYINQFERDILCSILEGNMVPDFKRDAVYGLYQRFSMQCLPATSEEELKKHILTMARAEFVYKPMFFLSAMRRGIGDHNLVALQKELPVNKISRLYGQLSPTPQKVIKKLKKEREDLMAEEQRVFNFLTIYVGDMNNNLLQRFLHFVTGSTATPGTMGIRVCFNRAQGLSRVPCATTCSATLTLSTTYESYAEFKKEFDLLLASEEAFELSVL